MSKNKKYIALKKTFYGTKGVLDTLDENFIEFKPLKDSPKKFFKHYNRHFYDLQKSIHQYFIRRSIKYAFPDGYIDPLSERVNELKQSLKDLQEKIDGEERNHFFIKNGSFLMNVNDQNLTAGGGYVTQGMDVYYVQSGKKRKITDFQVYTNLKTRERRDRDNFGNTRPDKNFVLFVDTETLEDFADGPDINVMGDINITFLEVNIYPQTLNEYNNIDPLDIEDNIAMATQLINREED